MIVTIIIKWVSHYRIPFYEQLRDILNREGIELRLVYSEPISKEDKIKSDWSDVPWGIKIRNKEISIFGIKMIWQPALFSFYNSDLVIVESANKLLLNYILQLLRLFTYRKVAFWGHGKNFQSTDDNSIKERWKRLLLNKVDWWFAYNDLCVQTVIGNGFKKERITSVNNAIDTRSLKTDFDNLHSDEIEDFKQKHKISGRHVGVYCGGMYREKRLTFLISAAMEIRKKVPDFELILIGAGEDQFIVENYASSHDWIHYLGPLFGKTKLLAMKCANLYLMPGLVGLGVLDAFAMRLPVITTAYEFHSPEISYVENGVNGIVSANDQASFIRAVIDVLQNDDLQETLRNGCSKTASNYTIENMALNFSTGIIECLAH